MNFRLLGVLFLFFYVSAASASNWTYCTGTGAGHLSVSSVTLNPDPPARGKDEIVSLTGSVDETVSGGTIHLTISFAGFTVYDHTYNVCDSVACPFTSKDISASITVPGSAIPSISPPGTYTGKATLVDQTGASLACVQVQFTLPANLDAPKMSPKKAAELMALFNGVEF